MSFTPKILIEMTWTDFCHWQERPSRERVIISITSMIGLLLKWNRIGQEGAVYVTGIALLVIILRGGSLIALKSTSEMATMIFCALVVDIADPAKIIFFS